MSASQARVAVAGTEARGYPEAPYNPDQRYAEYEFGGISPHPNPVYAGVREVFEQLGLDSARRGGAAWNPLGDLVRPGARVLIKPNLVRHFHPYGYDRESLVTHGSVIRAVCDYALRAAGAAGEVVIADAPLQSCDFEQVRALAGLDAIVDFYRRENRRVEVRDLRLVRTVASKRFPLGRLLVRLENNGDPLGYTPIDLGDRSLHAGRPEGGARYRVTCYDPARMRRHHGRGRHEYVIANTLLDADVVINLPKMKTHHKAGVTGALKNFIGINGHKDCLPHHTKGTPEQGGDEYPQGGWSKRLDSWLLDARESVDGAAVKKAAALAHRILYRFHMNGPESYWEGSWYGNGTIARTTLDLNRIVLYAGGDGVMRARPQRAVLHLVDGIIAGELDGPLAPTPKPAGVLLGGLNAAAVDAVMARLMGFRRDAIPTLRQAFALGPPWPLAEFEPERIQVVSRCPRWDGLEVDAPGDSLEFRPHHGWQGHVELGRGREVHQERPA